MVKNLSYLRTSGACEMSCMKMVSIIFLSFPPVGSNRNVAMTNTFQGVMLQVRQILIPANIYLFKVNNRNTRKSVVKYV